MTNAMTTANYAGAFRVIRSLISIFFPEEYFNSLAFPPSIHPAEKIVTNTNYLINTYRNLINTYKNLITTSKLIAHVMGFLFFHSHQQALSPLRLTRARCRDVMAERALQKLIPCV